MSTTTQVIGLPVSFDAYIRHGWKLVAIPPGVKGPQTPRWNERDFAITDSTQIPAGYGVGLAHAYSGTCAIDIDNWESAVKILAEKGIDLTALYTALDAVTIESGRAGRGKLIYRMPFGITLHTKKVTYTSADGSRAMSYELRCASSNDLTVQDVLPPTIHPLTNLPYRWGGKGQWSALPTLPMELLNHWQSLVDQDSKRSIPTETIDASWDEIRTALYTIPADSPRDDWLTALMALHHAGTHAGKLDQAEALAHEWSATGAEKYKGPRDFAYVWSSLKSDQATAVRVGSLFHLAIKHGYKRPIPDVQAFFQAVTPQSPEQVTTDLKVPAPFMDMDLWPKVLRDAAMEISVTRGLDPLIPLWAGVAAVCGAVDGQTRLELMHGFSVPPLLWMMTIGAPGDKKSPGSRPMFRPLYDLEAQDKRRYGKAMLEWEALDTVYQQSKKDYMMAALKSTNTILTGNLEHETLPPVAPEPPRRPVEAQLIVSDVTSQKLGRLCAERPRGMLMELDEMKGWLDRVTNPKSGEDRGFWTRSYESERYRMNRVDATGNVEISNLALSIYGNIQPRVFRDIFERMSTDGNLQRFLPAVTRSEFQRMGQPIPAEQSVLPLWDMKLRELYALPALTYTLDSAAYQAFRDFQTWFYENKQDEKILQAGEIYLEAYGKLEGTTGRLALILHLMTDPYSLTVSKVTMGTAIAIIRTYVIPALRYALDEFLGLGENSLENWLKDRLIQLSGIQETITVAEIRHSATRKLENVPRNQQNVRIADAMYPFEQAQWVTLVNDNWDKRQWIINPNLAKMYDKQREAVIRARQKRRDEAREIVLRSGKTTDRRIVKGYDPDTMD